MLCDKTIVVRKLAYLHNLLQETIKEINEILSTEVFDLTMETSNVLNLK